jgi:hypothetical protein
MDRGEPEIMPEQKRFPVLALAFGSPTVDSLYLSITDPDGTTIRRDLELAQLELIVEVGREKARAWRETIPPSDK